MCQVRLRVYLSPARWPASTSEGVCPVPCATSQQSLRDRTKRSSVFLRTRFEIWASHSWPHECCKLARHARSCLLHAAAYVRAHVGCFMKQPHTRCNNTVSTLGALTCRCVLHRLANVSSFVTCCNHHLVTCAVNGKTSVPRVGRWTIFNRSPRPTSWPDIEPLFSY